MIESVRTVRYLFDRRLYLGDSAVSKVVVFGGVPAQLFFFRFGLEISQPQRGVENGNLAASTSSQPSPEHPGAVTEPMTHPHVKWKSLVPLIAEDEAVARCGVKPRALGIWLGVGCGLLVHKSLDSRLVDVVVRHQVRQFDRSAFYNLEVTLPHGLKEDVIGLVSTFERNEDEQVGIKMGNPLESLD